MKQINASLKQARALVLSKSYWAIMNKIYL